MGTQTRLLMLGVAVLLPLGTLLYRVESGAQEAWLEAVQAESDGQIAEAAYQYQRSAKWNSVLTDTSDRAREKLSALSKIAESTGHIELALLSQRYLRGTLMATHHIWRQSDSMLMDTNRVIARLTAHIQLASGAVTIRGRTLETLTADHLKLLLRRNGPTPGQGSLVFILFLAWVGSAVWTIWRGLKADGQINRNPMIGGALATTTLFLAFCLVLSKV